MRPRTRTLLLGATSALVIAFALAVSLDRPSSREPSRGSPAGASSTADGRPAGAGAAQGTSATSPSGFDGAALPSEVRAHDFTLTDLLDGAPVSLSRYRGKVVVLAFLYSTCGATCVVLAQQIRGALDELAGRPPEVLFVSADPAVDTAARVRRFLARVSLVGRARYLSGAGSQLRGIWRAYGATPASAGRRSFDAAAAVLLIDPRGLKRVIFPLDQLTPEALAHDIRRLQAN